MSEPVKVTINEAPEAYPIAADSGPAVVTDNKGRRLKLSEPDILAPFRLVEIIGAESAENRVYMSMVFPLLYLSEIDGEAVFPPNSKRELEALIKRLNHDGIKALREGVEKYFGAKNETDQNAAVKK